MQHPLVDNFKFSRAACPLVDVLDIVKRNVIHFWEINGLKGE